MKEYDNNGCLLALVAVIAVIAAIASTALMLLSERGLAPLREMAHQEHVLRTR